MFIYRNDDFNFAVNLPFLKTIHGYFEKVNVNHTIALQFDGQKEPCGNEKILDYIRNTSNWDIQLHCWEHYLYKDLDKSKIYDNLKYMIKWTEKNLGTRPTVFYPPWGRTGTGKVLEEATKKLDILVEPDCAFINYYCGAIANGEKYFKTAVTESNHFIPYSKWRSVYFHLGPRDQVFLIPFLIDVTQEIARGEIDHLDFEKKKESIEKLKEVVERVRKGDIK